MPLVRVSNGGSTENVDILAKNSTSGSFVLSTETYGSEFIVMVDIKAYQTRYSMNITTDSGVTYSYLKPMASIVMTYNVTSYVCAIKVSGSGNITISYTSPDGNIHACQVTVVY